MNAPFCRVFGRWLILAVPLLSGCGLRHYQRELLERDLRWQEDELYRLTAAVEDLQDQLDAARRENEVLREDGADCAPAPGAETVPAPRGEPRTDIPPSAPEIELGVPSEDGGETLRRPPSSIEVPPYDGPPQFDPLPPAEGESVPAEIDPSQGDPTTRAPRTWPQVSEITLNRLLTGGHNKDGRFGDEGLLVVVEPRDVTGQVVPVPGRISFVLLDPACRGRAARVARWDFSEAEVQRRFRQGVFGKGLRFELPWPNRPPQHGQLKLYVRMTLPDGQQLAADKAVTIDLRPRDSHEWAAVSAGDGPVAVESGPLPEVASPEGALPTDNVVQAPPDDALEGETLPSGDGWSARAQETVRQALPEAAEDGARREPPYAAAMDPEGVVYEPGDGAAGEAPAPISEAQPPDATEREGDVIATLSEDDSNARPRRATRPMLGSPRGNKPGENVGTRERRGWAPYR